MTDTTSNIVIDGVAPSVDGGRWPAKRTAGRPFAVHATILKPGEDALGAELLWRRKGDREWTAYPMLRINPGLDLWAAAPPSPTAGRYQFRVQAWTDTWGSWVGDLRRRVTAGQTRLESERAEGLALLAALKQRAPGAMSIVDSAIAELRAAPSPTALLETAERDDLRRVAAAHESRADLATTTDVFEVIFDDERATAGAWYGVFIRSQGADPSKPATFREAERRLSQIASMGFDVLYLAPFHPIGMTNRKGRNGATRAAPGDPGSPWAVGSAAGGHDAVDPVLGTIEDFDHFVAEAKRRGLAIAMDLALQASPDHPWVREHPDWFYRRADGTLRCAENPPMRYEDVHPLNFEGSDREGLYRELRRVILFWISHGVRIFRVDNPHTKPLAFWARLIEDVQADHPNAVFLAEAFTRPPMMRALSKAGFSQSLTYYIWRNTAEELREYLTELTRSPLPDYFRPNFFVHTPDVNPLVLQSGRPAAFRLRLLLAATLAPSYGIMAGFELCEHEAMPGSEEYRNSEKFEIRVRDWGAPHSLAPFLTTVNRIRREHACLRRLDDVRFLRTDNPQLLAYLREDGSGDDRLIIVANLDPESPQEGHLELPADGHGLPETFRVHDLLTGARYDWGRRNYVRLDPEAAPAHVLAVEGPAR